MDRDKLKKQGGSKSSSSPDFYSSTKKGSLNFIDLNLVIAKNESVAQQSKNLIPADVHPYHFIIFFPDLDEESGVSSGKKDKKVVFTNYVKHLCIFNPSQKLSELIAKTCKKKGLEAAQFSHPYNLYGYPLDPNTNVGAVEGKSIFLELKPTPQNDEEVLRRKLEKKQNSSRNLAVKKNKKPTVTFELSTIGKQIQEIDLGSFPKEIASYYKPVNLSGWSVFSDQAKNPVFSKEIVQPQDHSFVMDLLSRLDGDCFLVNSIHAIFNVNSIANFALLKQKYEARAAINNELFFSQSWKDDGESDFIKFREFTDQFFMEISHHHQKLFTTPNSDQNRIKIMPAVYGTSAADAWNICVEGYPHKQGAFGSGHYFTTSARYSSPFFVDTDQPAIVISYIITGNPYPLIDEDLRNSTSTSLKPGFQSHYICTGSDRQPVKEINYQTDLYGEIVINQEDQVMPAFILILEPHQPCFPALLAQFPQASLDDLRSDREVDEETPPQQARQNQNKLVDENSNILKPKRKYGSLPNEISVHFVNAMKSKKNWEQVESNPPLFRKELIKPKDKEVVMQIFNKLGGEGLPVKQIFAVYNPSLVSQFNLTKEKLEYRSGNDKSAFFHKNWKNIQDTDGMLREWSFHNFELKMEEFAWNADEAVGILPVIHGTSTTVAWKVCHNGFANLSKLDVGWYGSGMYFSTSAQYCLPYAASKPNPCFIISYLIPGNPYPVVEQPNDPAKSLSGRALARGYQAHYVSTTPRGLPFEAPASRAFCNKNKYIYDEIIINQESQVTPAYIIVLEPATLYNNIKQFEIIQANFDKENSDNNSIFSKSKVSAKLNQANQQQPQAANANSASTSASPLSTSESTIAPPQLTINTNSANAVETGDLNGASSPTSPLSPLVVSQLQFLADTRPMRRARTTLGESDSLNPEDDDFVPDESRVRDKRRASSQRNFAQHRQSFFFSGPYNYNALVDDGTALISNNSNTLTPSSSPLSSKSPSDPHLPPLAFGLDSPKRKLSPSTLNFQKSPRNSQSNSKMEKPKIFTTRSRNSMPANTQTNSNNTNSNSNASLPSPTSSSGGNNVNSGTSSPTELDSGYNSKRQSQTDDDGDNANLSSSNPTAQNSNQNSNEFVLPSSPQSERVCECGAVMPAFPSRQCSTCLQTSNKPILGGNRELKDFSALTSSNGASPNVNSPLIGRRDSEQAGNQASNVYANRFDRTANPRPIRSPRRPPISREASLSDQGEPGTNSASPRRLPVLTREPSASSKDREGKDEPLLNGTEQLSPRRQGREASSSFSSYTSAKDSANRDDAPHSPRRREASFSTFKELPASVRDGAATIVIGREGREAQLREGLSREDPTSPLNNSPRRPMLAREHSFSSKDAMSVRVTGREDRSEKEEKPDLVLLTVDSSNVSNNSATIPTPIPTITNNNASAFSHSPSSPSCRQPILKDVSAPSNSNSNRNSSSGQFSLEALFVPPIQGSLAAQHTGNMTSSLSPQRRVVGALSPRELREAVKDGSVVSPRRHDNASPVTSSPQYQSRSQSVSPSVSSDQLFQPQQQSPDGNFDLSIDTSPSFALDVAFNDPVSPRNQIRSLLPHQIQLIEEEMESQLRSYVAHDSTENDPCDNLGDDVDFDAS